MKPIIEIIRVFKNHQSTIWIEERKLSRYFCTPTIWRSSMVSESNGTMWLHNFGVLPTKGLCRWFRCDQHVVGAGFRAGGNAEKGAEGGMSGAAAVEAEHELIEIGLKVLAA